MSTVMPRPMAGGFQRGGWRALSALLGFADSAAPLTARTPHHPGSRDQPRTQPLRLLAGLGTGRSTCVPCTTCGVKAVWQRRKPLCRTLRNVWAARAVVTNSLQDNKLQVIHSRIPLWIPDYSTFPYEKIHDSLTYFNMKYKKTFPLNSLCNNEQIIRN